jgi:hypothetical protein
MGSCSYFVEHHPQKVSIPHFKGFTRLQGSLIKAFSWVISHTGVPPLMHRAGSPGRVSKHNIMRLGR